MALALLLRESSEALSQNVAVLTHGVVRVVRTSTQEVDRRRSPRYTTDMAGRVVLADGRMHAVRVIDLSQHGARVVGAPEAAAQTQGTLTLDGTPPLPFAVVGAAADGLRLLFRLDEAGTAALAAVIERLARARAA